MFMNKLGVIRGYIENWVELLAKVWAIIYVDLKKKGIEPGIYIKPKVVKYFSK